MLGRTCYLHGSGAKLSGTGSTGRYDYRHGGGREVSLGKNLAFFHATCVNQNVFAWWKGERRFPPYFPKIKIEPTAEARFISNFQGDETRRYKSIRDSQEVDVHLTKEQEMQGVSSPQAILARPRFNPQVQPCRTRVYSGMWGQMLKEALDGNSPFQRLFRNCKASYAPRKFLRQPQLSVKSNFFRAVSRT